MKPRTRKQFRLSWMREGAPIEIDGHVLPNVTVKRKNFQNREQAERHVRILTSDEPWREWAPEKGPDDYACCRGDIYSECGCGGYTNAEKRDEARKDLPPIQWIRLEVREITSTPFVTVEFSSPLPMTEKDRCV